MTNFVVGPTITEFSAGWDPELAVTLHGRWAAEGYMSSSPPMTAEDMADQVIRVLASGARIDEVHVMPDSHGRSRRRGRGHAEPLLGQYDRARTHRRLRGRP